MKISKINCPTHDLASHLADGGRLARPLRRAASAALIGLALLSASTAALAGIPGIDASVTSLVSGLPDAKVISYNTGGTTYQSAYKVRIANQSGNVNRIFFTAVTNVFNSPLTSPPQANNMTAPFIVPVPGCTPTPDNTRLDCEFGPLPAGSAPIEFTLLVTSPTVQLPQPDSKLAVAWTIQAGQGQANPSNLVFDVSELVTLKAGSAKDGVQSFVLADTSLGVADPSLDNAATSVTPPEDVTVGVKQDQYLQSCSADYKKCFISTISIVDNAGVPIPFDPADPIAIDLFRPIATLNKTANIVNAVLSYSSDGANFLPITECNRVGKAWQIPATISPANAQGRCVVPAKPNNKLTYADKLGWHIRVLAATNGVMSW